MQGTSEWQPHFLSNRREQGDSRVADWALAGFRAQATAVCSSSQVLRASCCDFGMQPQDPGPSECCYLALQAGNAWPCRSAILYQETS